MAKNTNMRAIGLICACAAGLWGAPGLGAFARPADVQASSVPDEADTVSQSLADAARRAEAEAHAANKTRAEVRAAIQAALIAEIKSHVAAGASASTISASLSKMLATVCRGANANKPPCPLSTDIYAAGNGVLGQLSALVSGGTGAAGGNNDFNLPNPPPAPDPGNGYRN
jgi:hypothetical protein